MKFLFITILTFSVLLLKAQTEKGTVIVGGNLGFQTGEKSSEFSFTPNIGFFVANNFAFGGSLNFSSSKFGNTKISSFGLGPFARYYIGKTSTKPFLVTEFEYLNSTTEINGEKNNVSGIGFLFGMGFAAFINETVAVEGITGYNYNKFSDVDGGGGFAMRFGFQVYLNNRSMKSLKTNVTGQ